MTKHDRRDASDIPIITNVMAKVGVLERRKDYLSRKLERGDYHRSSAAEFDRTELSAIEAAIRALTYHWATLQPEADPVVALSKLIVAVEAHVNGNGSLAELKKHLAKASRVAEGHKKK